MNKTFDSLSHPDFRRNFAEFRSSAFRLEALQVYDVAYEEDTFRRFMNGNPRGDNPSIGSWLDRLASGIPEGKTFQRVHLVMEPLSDYMRFECAWSYRDSSAAGEDVRILLLEDGRPTGLPELDYWLFDSAILVKMYYQKDGVFLRAEMTDDSNEVVRAIRWRELAVEKSIPFAEYDNGFDEFMHRIDG